MSKDMIPASAAALEARLSSEQLRRRILRGEIRGELVAGRWIVDASSLATWIDRHSHPAPAA